MAELAFKVKAEYDQVVYCREELARLRGEMLKVDTTTEAGQRAMASLEKQFQEVTRTMRGLVSSAAEAAYQMKDGFLGADDAAVSLMNTIKNGESSIHGLLSSFGDQINDVTQGIEDSQAIIGSLLDDMQKKLTDLTRERNLASANGEDERVEELNNEIEALENNITAQKEMQSAMVTTRETVNAQIQAIKDAIAAYDDLADRQENVSELTEESARAMEKDLQNAMQNILNKMGEFQGSVSDVGSALDNLKRFASSYRGTATETTVVTEVLTKKQTALSKSTIELAKNLAKLVLPANAARVAISLLTGGLGAAAIAGATILVKKLIDRYKEQKRAAEEAAEAQREMSEEIGKAAAKPIAAFEELRRKWMSLSTEMDKNEFLKENKKELDKLGISIDSVDQAEALFIEHTQDYWNAQITRAKADLYRAKIQGAIERQVSLEDEIEKNKDGKKNKRITLKNGRFTDNSGQEHFYNDELGRALFGNVFNVNGGKDFIWVNEEAYNARLELHELTKNGGELDKLKEKVDETTKSENELNEELGKIGRDKNYQESVNNLKKGWEDAKSAYEAILKDSSANKGQVEDARKKVQEAASAYKALTGVDPEGKKTSGGRSKKDEAEKEKEEREKAYEQYGKQIQAMIRSVENDIAKEQIAAIEDNSKAIEAQLDLEKQALVEKAEEIGKAMSELFAGNVDLLHRKTIDASKLAEKGWEDAGEGIATVFSSGYGAYDKGGKMHELLITPILPNGEVLSPEEVQNYVDNILDGAADFLAADEKGIVIAVDVDKDGGEKLHEMQEVYYDLLRLVGEYDAIKRENRQKEVDRRNEENQNAFLQQYGTFEEKRSAIRKKYQKERENEETEWGKKILDIREKTELAGIDAEQTAFRLANARRSGNIAEERKQLEEYYDIQIKDAEAKNEIAKAAELLEQKERALFELRTRGDYAKLFGDIQKYTRAELEAAKQLGDVLLKNGDLTKEQQKDVREALNAIEDEQRSRNVLPSGSIEEHLKKYIEGQRELQRLRKERGGLEANDNDELFKLEEQIKRWEELTGKEKDAIIWKVFSQSVDSSAKYMRDLADATGDINVEGIADMAEGLSFTVKLLEGVATGGWIGAIMAVVSEIVSAVSDEVKLSKELELRTKGLADAFEMLELSFDARKFSSIFGGGNILSTIKEYSNLAKDSGKALSDAIKALNEEDYGPGESWEKRSAKWITTSNYYSQLEAYEAAVSAGQKGLQTMLVKTKDRAGILNYFGLADKYETLYDIAPEIFNQDGTLNIEKTEVFLKSDMSKYLDDTQRQALENAAELNAKYEENLKGLKDSLSSLFGNINDILAEATMNGIKNGSRLGVEYMKDQMNGVVEALGTDLLRGIYSQYTSEYESKMLEMIKNGNASSDDFLNLLDEMMVGIEPTLTAASEAVREFNETAREKGYNIDRPSNADATTKSFQQISETTGSAIQGGVTALRLSSEVRNEHLSMMSANLDEMLRQQMLATTLAENIRAIQVDAYLALVEIRNNTADNLATVRGIAENVASIEKRTREL